MGRKRIAVLIAQVEENTQNHFMQGLLSEAFRKDYDVITFSMYQKYQETPQRERGDSNIFNLIQQNSLFDAFIIMADTIQTPGVLGTLEEQLHSYFDGPVLVVDRESHYFPNTMIDHRTPVRKLIDHLIDVHGYRDIVFLNGRKEHIHSVERLKGYMDSLMAHDIPVDESRIYYGDYWYDSGDYMVDELLADREHLPDAIACANDCMAIGVCSRLTKHGIRIPEDIAVIGYDSTDEGRRSPVPLTSADIPAKECGIYCVNWLDAAIHNKPIPDFETNAPLFIGRSCGCEYHRTIEDINQRQTWETGTSSTGFFSCFNHMMEDLLSQTTYQGFFNTVFQYTYQIQGFDSFHLCLNENWDVSKSSEEDVIRYGYSNKMCRVVRCSRNKNTDNSIGFTDTFSLSKLLPELLDDRKKPCSFIFTPLHFEDHCLGYAVISYGNEARVYDETYHLWLRSVMQGLECFNRQYALTSLIEKMESTQVRDALTGLYNLRGFLAQAEELCEAAMFEGKEFFILSVDMNGLRNINTNYGRKEGDRAILMLSQIINESILPEEICGRMCNDEFLIAYYAEPENDYRTAEIKAFLSEQIEQFNEQNETYRIVLCFGTSHDMIPGKEALEHLVNDSITEKNAKKALMQKQAETGQQLTPEDLENDRLVTEILDHNLFTYHFQPIVNAHNGEIYSYEALMRSNTTRFVPPLTIIKCAERLNRLHDVEKATFYNVLNYMSEHKELFGNRKVFINSIPGYQLEGDTKTSLEMMLVNHSGNLVVELTEESEIDDEALSDLKKHYASLNIETAVDDYGSGYSNVNNLLRYMPHYVKIDRMLIADIQDNPQKQHFVRDIIEFAHDNEIMALAEGVETSKELREVIRLGADLIQGYYTAKPQPEPIVRIDEHIRNEIVQFNQSTNTHLPPKKYMASAGEKISLIQLVLGKYTNIIIPGNIPEHSQIELQGAFGFQSNLSVQIENGFNGTVVLNSVSFGGAKGQPCIELQENVQAIFCLNGDNELRTGGICVPESSSLTIQGEGNLNITINSGRYYAIGNDIESRHGKLIFEQDGGIIINANGMRGVAIGSGLGGHIHIKRGWYRFDLNGQTGVGIGSLSSDNHILIEFCDMEFHSTIADNVIIGSLFGDACIHINNTSAKFWGGGNHVIGIGSLQGQLTQIELINGSFSFNIRAMECIGIGGQTAQTDIDIQYATVDISTQGKSSYAIGSYANNAKISFYACDIRTNINTNYLSDFGASEEDISIVNSRASFQLNGADIHHETEQAPFTE